jgi:Flp pilus assembly protein TadG
MPSRSRSLKDDSGQVAVIVAILLTVLVAVAALVIDIGRVELEKAHLQTAADAAALAAASKLPNTALAEDAARDYLKKNGYSYSASDPALRFAYLPDAAHATKIGIAVDQTVEYTLAKVIGFNNTTVTSKAAAAKKSKYWFFDYALFSMNAWTVDEDTNPDGSRTSSTKNIVLNGKGHSNVSITLAPPCTLEPTDKKYYPANFSGSTLSSHGFINPNEQHPVSMTPNVGIVELPDFSGDIITGSATRRVDVSKKETLQKWATNGTLDLSYNYYVYNSDPRDANFVYTIGGMTLTGVGTILSPLELKVGSGLVCNSPSQVFIYSTRGGADHADKAIDFDNDLSNAVCYAPNGKLEYHNSPVLRANSVAYSFFGPGTPTIWGSDFEVTSAPASLGLVAADFVN